VVATPTKSAWVVAKVLGPGVHDLPSSLQHLPSTGKAAPEARILAQSFSGALWAFLSQGRVSQSKAKLLSGKGLV